MARLQADGAKIQFVEYMQIGHGNDVTYKGLKRKYGRYPVGGIESSLSKLFKEMLLSTRTGWHQKAEALFMVSHYPIEALVVFATFAAALFSASAICFDSLPPTIFFIGYLLILSQSLQLLVGLFERQGYLKGFRSFVAMYLPISLLYVSYLPHYLEQLGKALRGYAQFNISQKLSEQIEDSWDNTYQENRAPLNIGGIFCGLLLANIILVPWRLPGCLGFVPFLYNGIVWAIGPFLFIPRKSRLLKFFDMAGSLPYTMVRSYIDFGVWILKWFEQKIQLE